MTEVFVLVIFLVSLFISAVIGYGAGVRDGHEHGFKEGVESEKLRTIEKLEPIWKQRKMTAEEIQENIEEMFWEV